MGCLEKLKRCVQIPSKTAPMHPLVNPLLDLLKGEGEGISKVQALAAAVGCAEDERDLLVASSVDHLMLHLVHTLMSCSDFKVRDMGHRQELKFVVSKRYSGCSHRPCDKIIKHQHYAATLRLKQFEGGEVSAVQNALDNSLKTECKQTCDQCNEENVLSLRRHINIHCDPDFLTLFFDHPRNLKESDLVLQFSESTYAVKVVTHWDKERQKSAVSVKRSDGWWWHGTDMDQAPHYKYTEKQMSICNPIPNAIVLMCVRVVPFDQCKENDENVAELLDFANSQGETNNGENQQLDDDDNCAVGIEGNGIYDTLMEFEEGQNHNGEDLIVEENQNREQSRNHGLENQNLLYDFEAAVIESRRTNPNLKTQAQMVEIGIRCMESFGVACSRPDDYTPLNGDCLWTCFAKSRDPSLVGNALRAETFHYRLKCVGAAIEEIKSMDVERLAMVQSVIADAKVGVPPQSREEIIAHLKRYMERGIWDGKMGDLLPYIAASFLNQGLLIVNLDSCTITYAAPECKMFHGREDSKFPCIAVRQLNHFEGVPIKHDYKGVASALYDMIKNGEHLTLPAEVGGISDGQFKPDQTSTPLIGGNGLNEKNREVHLGRGTSRSMFEEQHEQRGAVSSQSTGQVAHKHLYIQTIYQYHHSVHQQAASVQSSLRVGAAHQCICNFEGVLADHLRGSKPCVSNLRQEPSLQMLEDDDEVFIVKATLILKGCPARGCPGGSHKKIPDNCLLWWREVGWNIMRFKGSSENADSATVNHKTGQFRKNFTLRKTKGAGRAEEQKHTCRYCQTTLPLVTHLREAASCLQHYRAKYLPYHGGLYGRIPRLAIFDLSLVQGFCPNPGCTTIWRDLAKHLRGPCLEFYQSEGAALFPGWGDSGGLYAKLAKRKNHIKSTRDACSRGPQIYTQELGEMLRIICCTCFLQGPFLNEKDHQMICAGTAAVDGTPLWQCGECQHQQNIEPHATRIQHLGSPGEGRDDTLVPLKVEDECDGEGRVVFVPAILAGDHPIEDVQHLPQSTTVLVPKIPEAVSCIGEESLRSCYDERTDLKKATDFISKRPFQNSVQVTLSTLYRKKLSDIQEERLTLMHSMSISKGEVTSRDPPQATVIERRAHYDATRNLCLTKTCPWSLSQQQLMMDESSARSHVSGQMKTRVTLGLTTKVATDNQELREVIEITYHRHGVIPLLSIAPLVLKHVKAKVTLLEKHIFSNLYNNWDLEVIFEKEEWTVNLSGFLYSEEFENINKRMAEQGVSGRDIVSTILDHPHMCPTVSLDPQNIADCCSISMERAQVANSQITYQHISTNKCIYCHCCP